MKEIGLLGGTSWPSTLQYYRLLNQMAAERMGGHHSARLLLKNIDYHAIKSHYHAGWEHIPGLLKCEMEALIACAPSCLIICNNTLHKAYDLIAPELGSTVPLFHAVELTAAHAVSFGYRKLLLLATRFTMEDGFFQRRLEASGLAVTIPDAQERENIQSIQDALARGEMRPQYRGYFTRLIAGHSDADAVILACTELPLAICAAECALPIIDPISLQCAAAMDFALN